MPHRPLRLAPATLAVLSLLVFTRPLAHATDVEPTDGMTITSSMTLRTGAYTLPAGLEVRGDSVVLDGNGAELRGSGEEGYGVRAAGVTELTIKNVSFRGYRHAIHLEDVTQLRIEGCSFGPGKETYDRTREQGPFLRILTDHDNGYGHAIWLRECTDVRITVNVGRLQEVGIGLYGCRRGVISGNDFSGASAWGVKLYESCELEVRDNLFDDCYRVGAGYRGGDAAGILLVVDSNDNRITDNSCRAGGNGIFLVGRGPGRRPPTGNHFARNDVSEAVNNGVEATFAGDNVWEHNIADRCNFGFWLGFSWRHRISDNQITNCYVAGVAIEHSYRNELHGNIFEQNNRGVWLRSGARGQIVNEYPDCRDSRHHEIRENVFRENHYGIYVEGSGRSQSAAHLIEGNRLLANQIGISLSDCQSSIVRRNFILDHSQVGVQLSDRSHGNRLYNNYLANAVDVSDRGRNTWYSGKARGPNIVGGPYLGGNYFESAAVTDTDGDGLGEQPHAPQGQFRWTGDQRPLAFSGADCDRNGVADENDPDCDGDGWPDACEIADGAPDCDADGLPDTCAIALGVVTDTDANGVPDTCQDCNRNGMLDTTDLANGTSRDCNRNGRPDECESSADCDGNGVLDICDLAAGAADCNQNGIPDTCDEQRFGPALDCNANGMSDACEIARDTTLDCNANGLIDACELGATGALGRYYVGRDFERVARLRLDVALDFGWEDGAPLKGFGRNEFSIRWTGFIETPPVTGSYEFFVASDDGLRLWIGDELVIDAWYIHEADPELTAEITLEGGRRYPIRVDYFEFGGWATCRVAWQPPGQPRATLDGSVLRLAQDCNANGIPDACDIASGRSADADLDLWPDECGTSEEAAD